MNYKVLGILAVLLVVGLTVQPVASMWNNGNWLPEDANEKCDNVIFSPESGVTSCIKNTASEPKPVSGRLYIMTLTHHSLIGKAFTIQRVDPSGVQFTNGALVPKEILGKMKVLAEPREFSLDHTGGWDDDLAEGTFFITLKDGNGGQPEYALVTITKGYPFYVVFKGHAISSSAVEKPVPGCRLVIDSARYGIRRGTPLDGHPGVEAEKTVWSWVGWKLRPLIENDQLFVSAAYPELHYNSLFGDPYEGVFKKLIVRFHYDCGECQQEQEQFTTDSIRGPCYTQHRVCVWEDEDLVITPATENKWCISDAPDEDQTSQ